MPGHGLVMTRLPELDGPSISLPSSSKSPTDIPGKGWVALPGFAEVIPGRGEIMMPPVSVCHQVSTTGQRPPPTFSWYHSQARGLIGSPTLPSSRSEERSCFSRSSVPSFMNDRMSVGAV